MPVKGKPWWAVAIAGGFGAVLGVVYLLVPGATTARAQPTAVSASLSEADRLSRMEATLKELRDGQSQITERLARIEGRLEK